MRTSGAMLRVARQSEKVTGLVRKQRPPNLRHFRRFQGTTNRVWIDQDHCRIRQEQGVGTARPNLGADRLRAQAIRFRVAAEGSIEKQNACPISAGAGTIH
jgi:hypothetical protein